MKLGELFIELGVVGDTKELKKALKQMKSAEKITSTRNKIEKQLGRHLKANEVNVIKNAYALGNMVTTTMKVATAIGGAVLALDRMAQSMIKVNQTFVGFQQQTGLSITKANKFVSALGVVSGTSKESVLNDLTTLSQKVFQLGMTGQGSSIFQKLGFSPLGMKPDEVINQVRKVVQAKKYDEATVTDIVDELGISRDWVMLLRSEDEFYNKVMADTNELQLKEEQRLKLYELGYENRLAHAKIEKEILEMQIALLPIVNAIENVFANILKFATAFPTAFIEVVGISSGVLSKLKPVQKLFLNIYKTIARIPAIGKALLPILRVFGVLSARLMPVVSALMLVYDLIKGTVEFLNGQQDSWFAKVLTFLAEKFGMNTPVKQEDTPVKTAQWARDAYKNTEVQMANYFYNNPVPASEINQQLNTIRNQNIPAEI